MVQEALKTSMTIGEGVDEMRCILANTKLNLCRGILREARVTQRLKVTLMKYKITYRGSIGDVVPSTSILGPSTSAPNPSTSWSDY